MQRQKLTINFDLKSRTQATFTYKRGEIDKNGVEVELTNINVTNATGQVRIKDPEGNSLEPGIVTVNESKATFTLPTYLTGTWEFEVRIFNDNGTTISSTYSYSVLESLDTDDANLSDHESAWDVWTKNEATRVSNESTRTTAESTRVSNENTRISNETKRQASITDIEKRFSSLTTAQQQQAEVADSRTDYNGVEHANLKVRLDNDFETLASLIPTDIAFDGYASVTTNDTLSGDVKNTTLTGQTLVNLANKKDDFTYSNGGIGYWQGTMLQTTKINTTYTFVLTVKNNTRVDNNSTWGIYADGTGGFTGSVNLLSDYTGFNGTIVAKVTTGDSISTYHQKWSIGVHQGVGSLTLSNLLILEGDHTDKPLEFFEGLKSAEVAEINTHGVNLFTTKKVLNENSYGNVPAIINAVNDNELIIKSGRSDDKGGFRYKLDNRKTYKFSIYNYTSTGNGDVRYYINSNDEAWINVPVGIFNRSISNADSFSIVTGNTERKISDITVVEVTGSEPSTYIPYQSSTVTLPSPIKLRSLPNGVADTYDFDTQTLTRRCGEVVLNGSESWTKRNDGDFVNTMSFTHIIRTGSNTPADSRSLQSDRFQNSHVSTDGIEGFGSNRTEFYLEINRSRLATPDVAGFKAWLAQNPTTVVYQLAEPTTEYIENNGQLRSFDKQTTVSTDSIVPVKISGNIPVNYASTLSNLATQARNLRIENTALIEQAESLSEQLNIAEQTNDYQDSLIDVSLMATDELYTLIEPLLPELFSNTKGGNAMVDAYVAMVIKGLKTIDQVPSRYREDVKRVLAELEK